MTPRSESSDPETGDDAKISELLASAKTIAVMGLSAKTFRPSNGVARYLQSSGFRIIPVNPNESSILGEKCYAHLEDIPEKVDIVDIFRRSELVAEIVDAAIKIKARAVWMQEGVVDEPSAERARKAELFVVMDLCIAKEIHKRIL
jgi:predicted CoA-binding protein